jgi:hypothetical protein
MPSLKPCCSCLSVPQMRNFRMQTSVHLLLSLAGQRQPYLLARSLWKGVQWVHSTQAPHGFSPCTGVTVSDVAVPDVDDPPCAARVSAAVRNLFAFESFAAEIDTFQISKNNGTGGNMLTTTLRLSHTSPDFTRAHTDHSQTLGLIERADLLLSLTKCHSVLQLPEFRLCIRFFRFACSTSVSVRTMTNPRDDLPLAASAFLRSIVGYGKCLCGFSRWWCRQPINVFFDFFSKLFAI